MGRTTLGQRIALTFALVLIIIVGLAMARIVPARSLSRPPTSTQPQPQPAQQDDLPLTLLETIPPANERWVDGPVNLLFDQVLDESATNYATISPDLEGDFSINGDKLIFTPSSAPESGIVYTVRLDGAASVATGESVGNAIEATFTGATPLLVTSNEPSNGALEIDTDSQVVIVFNRPVVALSRLDEQADLPNPLTIEPAVEGEGRWLSTSVYAFKPETAFAGTTTYTAFVDGVQDLFGMTLPQPHQFTFTTAAPIVDSSLPTGNLVPPDTTVSVLFTQPMDPETTAAAFSLTASQLGDSVPGEVGWDDRYMTLTFTPTEWLDFGVSYLIQIAESAQPYSRQGTIADAYSRSFTVVPTPAIDAVSPLQGAQEVSPDATVIIRFNAPISPTLVMENIGVSPMLTSTQVFSYYSDYMNELQLSWFKEPNTAYTVTIGEAIADAYGNQLGEDYHLHFTTGDYPAFVRLEADRFTHFTAYSDTRLGLLYRNVDTLNVDLYRMPESDFFEVTGPNQYEIWQNYHIPDSDANRIWTRAYDVVEERNVAIRQVITLTDEAGQELAPGIYFVEVAQPGVANQPDDPNAPEQMVDETGNSLYTSQAVIVISNNDLIFKKSDAASSLVWLTELRTGEPIADVPVVFYNQGIQVADGNTDEDGLLTAELRPDPNLTYAPVVAIAGEPGDDNFAVVSSEWSSGIAIWDFNLSGGWTLDAHQSNFYTDRPIYRPGQSVYWKGIVRALLDEQYQLPPSDLSIHVTVRDPLGNTISEDEMALNENGTLNGMVELADEALTGSYYMEVRLPLGGDRVGYAGTGFLVASYQPPEFEISLTPDKPEYQQGDTVQVKLQADYFSGGPLANAPITWRLLSDTYNFSWDKGPSDRYYSFQPYDPDQEVYDPYSGSFYLGLIREGVGKTAADGSFTIELPADISMAPKSQNWTFDVTAQSPNNEFVSASTTVPVHRADFYVGTSPSEYVGHVGEPSIVDFVTVAPRGQQYPHADIDIVIYEYKWNSVYARSADGNYRWETSIERTPVFTTTASTSDDGATTVEWTPTKGGQFQITVSAVDQHGNETSSSAYLWVAVANPNDFVAWPRANNDRIELVADKRLYEPGDTATILIPSSFNGPVQALVTIERSGVVSSEVITLQGNSETLILPIEEEYIPNIFVSVVIVKGIDETNPTPAMRLGYTQINVDTSAKELNIKVDTSAEVTEPGKSVAYTMTVADSAGEPQPDTEVSVAVVDKAVLSLATLPEQDLVDIFFYQRPLGVLTSALLTINRDRISAQLSDGAKGGGGGGDGAGIDTRSEFVDIAYWRADLTTDGNGIISFTVDLLDNLTTWRLVAKAVTDDTKVGNVTHDLIATKELQLRPLVSRFFTAGDNAEVGATVVNATGDALSDGQLSLAISGAEFTASSETSVAFELAGGELAQASWPIVIDPLATQVVMTFTSEAVRGDGDDSLTDAVILTIPIKQYVGRETVATSGEVTSSGATEAIRVPEKATGDGELEVNIQPSLAAGMVDGLAYLKSYPYESTEQIISSFLPNILTARATNMLGLDDPSLSSELDSHINLSVQRLVNRQNQDGGWGYWPDEQSSVFITAYALWGLSIAEQEGLTVPEGSIQESMDYIERSFVAPDRIEDQWQLNQMSFMLYVLSEIGDGDPGRTSTLYDVRDRLGLYGKAYLAMTLDNLQQGDARDPRIDTLLDDLYGSAQVTATSTWWQEVSVDYRNLNTDTRTTAIVLDAFIRLDPDQPLLPNAVRWLMDTRQEGHWSSTQETAWSLIALTDWLTLSGEGGANYKWSATLNGSDFGSGTVNPENVTAVVTLRKEVSQLLHDQLNSLHFSRSNNQGRMYYTTFLHYNLDAAEVEARDQGVVIERTFALADDASGDAIASAHVGDVLSVTVRIVAPNDLFHLLVELPIPAGTTPIDPNLATTSDQFIQRPMVLEDETTTSSPSWWRYWTPTYTDLRDDKVALFSTFLAAGTYEYTFNVRASLPGEFNVLPAYAEEIYYPEVWGRSGGTTFAITE